MRGAAVAMMSAASVGATMVTAGCVGDNPIATLHADQVLDSTQLTVHAANLALVAPYDTVRLSVIATLADGTPATAAGASIQYSTTSSDVTVDTLGLVRAISVNAGSPATVIVAVQYGGKTRRDSAQIQVTAGLPPQLPARLSLHTFYPESLPRTSPLPWEDFVDASINQLMAATLLTAIDDTVPNLIVGFSSGDSTVATIDATGNATGIRPGVATLYAETYAYGVRLRDSVRFTVTHPPVFTYFLEGPSFVGSDTVFAMGDTARIVTNGKVIWSGLNTYDLDIVFDDPAAADSVDVGIIRTGFMNFGATGNGNIAPFHADNTKIFPEYDRTATRGRRFRTAGVYPFHSVLRKVHGVIIVCDSTCP